MTYRGSRGGPKERTRPKRVGKDSEEWKNWRMHEAYRLAQKKIKEYNEELEKRGLQDSHLKKNDANALNLAAHYLGAKSDHIDKLVEKRLKELEEVKRTRTQVREKKSDTSKVGLAKGFKEHMRAKGKLDESDSKEKKESSEREPAQREKSKVTSVATSEKSTPLKDVFEGVRELRKNPEREKVSSMKNPESKIRIKTREQFEELVKKNPCINEHKEDLRRARAYFNVLNDRVSGKIPEDMTKAEMAKRYDIPVGSLSPWIRGKGRPQAFERLEILEKDRVKDYRKITPEAREHRIDSAKTYETFREFKDPEKRTIDCVVSALERLDRHTDKNLGVYHAKLKAYSESGPKWLKDVGTYIEKNRTAIEDSLNQLLHKEGSTVRTRLGMLEGTLYVRKHNQGLENWANSYSSDHFHFKSSKFKEGLVQDARRRLNSLGDRNLSRLMSQLGDFPEKHGKFDEMIELRKKRAYLTGATVDFMLDVTGRKLRDIESDISHLCGRGTKRGHGRINNPRFPQNVEQIRAQMLGAMLSDGHLRPKMAAKYYEKDIGRLKRFKEIIAQFGEVQLLELHRKDGTVLDFPVIIGRLLKKWGMPVGDKSVLNCGLPSDFHKSDSSIIAEYLGQMVSEDGDVTLSNKRARVRWGRSVALDGKKFQRYRIKSRIRPESKKFLISIGKEKKKEFKNPYAKEGRDSTVFQISWKELDKHRKSESEVIRSKTRELQECILNNPSRLLDDELKLVEKLGIKASKSPIRITYYRETGRVSVDWRAFTSTKIDGIRWALIAPPDHPRKKAVADKAIKMFPEEVKKVLEES